MKAIDKRDKTVAMAILLGAAVLGSDLGAQQFTEKELALSKTEYMSTVKGGETLFNSPQLGKKQAACVQCHPGAANTHPETYPKYKKQLGKVITIGEQVNWCIANALEGERLGLGSERMVSLITYIIHQRRGVALAPGKQ